MSIGVVAFAIAWLAVAFRLGGYMAGRARVVGGRLLTCVVGGVLLSPPLLAIAADHGRSWTGAWVVVFGAFAAGFLRGEDQVDRSEAA